MKLFNNFVPNQNKLVYLQFAWNFSLQSMCERSHSFYIVRIVTCFRVSFYRWEYTQYYLWLSITPIVWRLKDESYVCDNEVVYLNKKACIFSLNNNCFSFGGKYFFFLYRLLIDFFKNFHCRRFATKIKVKVIH